LCARSRDGLESMREDLCKAHTGLEVQTFPLDVADALAVSDMVTSTKKSLGRIDVLFNNAGIYKPGTSQVSLEDFSLMLEVNLKAAFHFISLVVPIMKEQKSGTIINIASRSGKIAKPETGGYAASKFGLIGLNEALHRELSSQGIRVSAICPGWVDTEMGSASGLTSQDMLSTDDIVKTVRWILSLSAPACVKEIFVETIKQVG
jgi:short-subunit dehydrogenase